MPDTASPASSETEATTAPTMIPLEAVAPLLGWALGHLEHNADRALAKAYDQAALAAALPTTADLYDEYAIGYLSAAAERVWRLRQSRL